MMVSTKTHLVVFFLLSIFGHLLEASNLEKHHKPQGKLNIGLDYGLVTRVQNEKAFDGERRWMFSSYLVFEDEITPSSLTNGQLKHMAVDAFNEMKEDIEQYDIASDRARSRFTPTVMTAMAFSNKIIFSSSQKGQRNMVVRYPEDNRVQRVLDLCQIWWRDHGHTDPETRLYDHGKDRKCGEVGAFWQYYLLSEDHPTYIKDLDPLARTLTVHLEKRRIDENGKPLEEEIEEINIMDPCGTGETKAWGCNILTDYENNDPNGDFSDKVDYLKESIEMEDYDLEKIVGGLKKIGQIQTCSKNKVHWRED